MRKSKRHEKGIKIVMGNGILIMESLSINKFLLSHQLNCLDQECIWNTNHKDLQENDRKNVLMFIEQKGLRNSYRVSYSKETNKQPGKGVAMIGFLRIIHSLFYFGSKGSSLSSLSPYLCAFEVDCPSFLFSGLAFLSLEKKLTMSSMMPGVGSLQFRFSSIASSKSSQRSLNLSRSPNQIILFLIVCRVRNETLRKSQRFEAKNHFTQDYFFHRSSAIRNNYKNAILRPCSMNDSYSQNAYISQILHHYLLPNYLLESIKHLLFNRLLDLSCPILMILSVKAIKIYKVFKQFQMTTRQQKIKKIRQLCDRATYQELESMDAKRLHSLNCNLLLYGLDEQYEHVFREAEKIQRRKIAGPPSPPGLSSLILSCFSSEEKSKKKLPTGKIMKDPPQQEQENQQEESFLVRKGSKHEKRPQNL